MSAFDCCVNAVEVEESYAALEFRAFSTSPSSGSPPDKVTSQCRFWLPMGTRVDRLGARYARQVLTLSGTDGLDITSAIVVAFTLTQMTNSILFPSSFSMEY